MLHEPKYTILQMAEASGVSPATIRSWYQRGHVRVGLTDMESPANGLARLFSASTVMLVSMMGALTNLGVHPARAAAAATIFCHTGSVAAKWEGAFEIDELDRAPGFLFSSPAVETLLVVTASDELFARVVPEFAGQSFRDIFAHVPNKDGGYIVLPLFNLVNRTRRALGLPQDNE
jgi:hypothetical protein